MKNLLCIVIILFTINSLDAQVGIGTNTPNPGAALDIESADKGILIPRLEITAVTSPVDGMMIYQPSDQSFYYYNGTGWSKIGGGNLTEMVDADGDTKIRLIEGLNDNITLTLDNTDHLRLVKSGLGSFRMELPNNKNNLAIGTNALFGNTSGIHNTALGQESLFTNQGGNNNTAIGRRALFSNINGNYNVAIGLNSLTSNTIGAYNTAIGLNALSGNLDGEHNTAIGQDALTNNTIGSKNVAIGDSSLSMNTEGNSNFAAGSKALQNNTTGRLNVALGERALIKNQIGNFNIAVGGDALLANIDGDNNIAIGVESLLSNIEGHNNTSLGKRALFSNIDGDNNIAIGLEALLENETGNNNIANGFQVLRKNISGSSNIANGYEVLRFNISGSSNIANGYRTLRLNNSGNHNIANGFEVLRLNNSGSDNIANGYQALLQNTSGSHNIASGSGSLQENVEGNHNIAIGFRSGSQALGSNNIFIGKNAGTNETDSNKLYIESSDISNDSTSSLVYGEFDNDMLRVNNKLGIGTQSVGYPLSIRGDNNNDLIMLKDDANADQWHLKLTNDNLNFVESGVAENRLFLEEGGNIGFGTNNPEQNLHVKSTTDAILKLEADSNNANEDDNAQVEFSQDGGNQKTWFGYDETRHGSNLFGISTKNKNGAFLLDADGNIQINGSIGINRVPITSASAVFRATAAQNAIFGMQHNNGEDRFLFFKNGDFDLDGIITYNSDIRLKKDITPISNALSELQDISGYRYYWKDENRSSKIQVGFIAQEIQKVFPELVSENKEGILSVNYAGMIPIMLEGIKKQQRVIDQQNDKIDKQEQRLDKLEKQIESYLYNK
jgi:hypothetical protein